MRTPENKISGEPVSDEIADFWHLKDGFRKPALHWFLGFSTLAYTLSYLGFVFERQLIFEALGKAQTQQFTIIISGGASAAMREVSLLALGVSKKLCQKFRASEDFAFCIWH